MKGSNLPVVSPLVRCKHRGRSTSMKAHQEEGVNSGAGKRRRLDRSLEKPSLQHPSTPSHQKEQPSMKLPAIAQFKGLHRRMPTPEDELELGMPLPAKLFLPLDDEMDQMPALPMRPSIMARSLQVIPANPNDFAHGE